MMTSMLDEPPCIHTYNILQQFKSFTRAPQTIQRSTSSSGGGSYITTTLVYNVCGCVCVCCDSSDLTLLLLMLVSHIWVIYHRRLRIFRRAHILSPFRSPYRHLAPPALECIKT